MLACRPIPAARRAPRTRRGRCWACAGPTPDGAAAPGARGPAAPPRTPDRGREGFLSDLAPIPGAALAAAAARAFAAGNGYLTGQIVDRSA